MGFQRGTCLPLQAFREQGEQILRSSELNPPPIGNGYTADRCWLHSNCEARSCLGISDERDGNGLVHKVSTCSLSFLPCVCRPFPFIWCHSQSECEPNEICATIRFQSNQTFSHFKAPASFTAVLPPLCVSSSLADHERVSKIIGDSPPSHPYNTVTGSLVQVEQFAYVSPASAPSTCSRHHQPVNGRENPPFSAPSVPVFNLFSSNELANEFITGIISLVILVQLSNIVHGIMYGTSSLKTSAVNRYLIFSRLTSLRSLTSLVCTSERTLSGRRWLRTARPIQVKYTAAFLPALGLLVLYATEISTIMASSQSRKEVRTSSNFDPVISKSTELPSPRRRVCDHCDDFFVRTRGLHEAGQVLKCVSNYTYMGAPLRDSLTMVSDYGSGVLSIFVFTGGNNFSRVELSTFVQTIGQGRFRTMPFRPDQNEKRTQCLLNMILNGIHSRLGYSTLSSNLTLWSALAEGNQNGTPENMVFQYQHNWTASLETITTAVVSELRSTDLVLNSTGPPWAFFEEFKYIPVENLLMAVTEQNRIPQGLLAIFAVLLTLLQMILRFSPHFDDVAYIAMKDVMGDDCVLGPIAGNKRANLRTVSIEDCCALEGSR